MISKITELYILCWTFKSQLKITVYYWNGKKDDKTNITCGVISNPNWKSQIIIEMITNMREPYIICSEIQIPIDKTLHLSWGHSKPNWKRQFIIETITKMTEHYIVCGDIQLPTEKNTSVLKWLQRWQNITFFLGTFKFRLKKQFSIEMTSKIAEIYILCRDIQVSAEKKQFSIEMISKMTEPCILCGNNQIPTERSVQHRNDFKGQRTLHSLLGYSIPNWKTQIIIQMITKMTDPDILCWRIQISIERSLHILLGHSNSNWKKTVHCPNDFKDHRTLHRLGDTQIPTGKKQFSIGMISIWQTPTSFVGTLKIQLKKTILYRKGLKDRKTLHPLWGHSNPNWKRQFIIEMITKMTEPYILCGDIQIPTEKDRSVIKWFQIWRNLTSFVGTFKFQLKKTVQYWNDYKDNRTLHSLWGHLNSNWKRQFSIEMISKITALYILCGDIQVSTEKKTV